MHFIPGANSEGAACGRRRRQEGVGWSRRGFLAPPGVLVQHSSVFHTEAEENPSVLQGTHPCLPGAPRAACAPRLRVPAGLEAADQGRAQTQSVKCIQGLSQAESGRVPPRGSAGEPWGEQR